MSRRSINLTAAMAKFHKVSGRTVNNTELAMLSAIEVLLTKPKRVKKTPTSGISAQFVHQYLRTNCPDLTLDSYTGADFGRLGKTIASIKPAVSKQDIEHLADWINGGALSFWSITITWQAVVKHFANWIAQSRAVEAEPQQPSALR